MLKKYLLCLVIVLPLYAKPKKEKRTFLQRNKGKIAVMTGAATATCAACYALYAKIDLVGWVRSCLPSLHFNGSAASSHDTDQSATHTSNLNASDPDSSTNEEKDKTEFEPRAQKEGLNAHARL